MHKRFAQGFTSPKGRISEFCPYWRIRCLRVGDAGCRPAKSSSKSRHSACRSSATNGGGSRRPRSRWWPSTTPPTRPPRNYSWYTHTCGTHASARTSISQPAGLTAARDGPLSWVVGCGGRIAAVYPRLRMGRGLPNPWGAIRKAAPLTSYLCLRASGSAFISARAGRRHHVLIFIGRH
jgi:hypothetical protein